MREDWVCMMRCRHEERWIRRSLERTFEVCKTVILLDDGSENDLMWQESMRSVLQGPLHRGSTPEIVSSTFHSSGPRQLHYLSSPFRPAVREKEAVSEIRDKNFLWSYAKARANFTHVLCLDGDEMLSKEAIRQWPRIEEVLENGTADVLTIPFIYLWDSESQRRVDGLYGDDGRDGLPRLRFPRIFTIRRVSEEKLFDMRFSWQGTKGGFHCGSIPQEGFGFSGGVVAAPVVHFGYIDEALRQRKFVFYNTIDPHNKFEGEYRHIIGQPDQHAPGPVQSVSWEDA